MSADLYLNVTADPDQFNKDMLMLSKHDYTVREIDTEEEYFDEDGLIRSKNKDDVLVRMLDDDYDRIIKSMYDNFRDRIWIGQYSSMKASLQGDNSYLPNAVLGVSDTVGIDTPVLIDDALITRIMVAMNGKRDSYYEKRERVTKFVDGRSVPYYNKQGKQPLKKSRFEREIGTISRKKVKKFLKAHKGEYIVATGE